MIARRVSRWPALLLLTLLTGCAAEPQWVRTELYFGLSRPDGKLVSEQEFSTFLNECVVSRFPDGLTTEIGKGRYRSDNGSLIEEDSRIVILLYPVSSSAANGQKIKAVCGDYIARFKQECVLEVDSPSAVQFVRTPKPGP